MLARPIVLSAYESVLTVDDMRYLMAALGKNVLLDSKVNFTLVREDDYATDTQTFRVEWARDNRKHAVTVADLETLVITLRALRTMEM